MRQSLVALLLAAPTVAHGDQLLLKGGGKLSGVLVETTAEVVVFEVAAGRVSLPRARVERIVRGPSALAEYRSRLATLHDGDVPAWLALALWARERGLRTQERHAFARVLALDPGNTSAQQALGNVLLGGRWLTPEQSYRAQGYVLFEGEWVLPEQRDEALRERAARERADAAERARAEAEARVREAEARAAAADARRAESQGAGYPLSWALAGGGCCLRTVLSPLPSPFVPPLTPPPPPPEPRRPRASGLVTPLADQRR